MQSCYNRCTSGSPDEAMAYLEKNTPVHAIKLDITDRAAYAAAADEVEKVFGSSPTFWLTVRQRFWPAEASTYDD